MGDNQGMAFNEERITLKKKIKELESLFSKAKEAPRYYGNDFTEQVLDEMRERKKEILAKALRDPYFGRLDFQEKDQAAFDPLYIGKVGVSEDDTEKLIVIDWRAPVASLFYSFTGEEENAFYDAPEGTIEGEIYLKRNIVIKNNQLERAVDSYVKGEENLTGGDEFLLYKLEENKDNRLRDIVSTIQSEQNKIIRYQKDTALIIQGVAGSGKTTVALHRLAYLLYHYRETIQAKRMMIFAPSQMFLDYISGVLPELGVGDIRQTTYTAWALNLLQDEYQLIDSGEELQAWFEEGDKRAHDEPQTSSSGFKRSLKFKDLLEQFMQSYEQNHVPSVQFIAWEGQELDAEIIRRWYLEDYRSYPLLVRRVKIIERIKRWIETSVKEKIGQHQQKEMKRKANQNLQNYLKSWLDLSLYELYQLLFITEKKIIRYAKANVAVSNCKQGIPAEVKTETSKYLKKNQLKMEDITPILYIHLWLNGHDRGDELEHVVIDEAQDFSPFQIEVIKVLTRGNSFTILGDLAQGIHSNRGISSWNEFISLFPEELTHYHELRQSYRSTMEIIKFANQIIAKANLAVPLAVPVFRSGNPVRIIKTSSGQHDQELISLVQALDKRINTVAIVGRTAQECEYILEFLTSWGINASMIKHDHEEYQGGISVIPIYLTKGLEFDAVILYNVDQQTYKKTEQDIKLLYVGCTRALHELYVMYKEKPSLLI